MDARQQRRADGERASSNGGRHGLDADLRRKIPAAVRGYGKIGRVLQGHLVGPALNHRKRRLGNDLWRRNSQLGGRHSVRREARPAALTESRQDESPPAARAAGNQPAP